MDNDSYKNIKRYLEDSYKYINIPEEAYQHNFGYIEGFNDAKGFSKDEYHDLSDYNRKLKEEKEIRKEEK